MNSVWIKTYSAVSHLGDNWQSIWNCLLRGSGISTNACHAHPDIVVDGPVGAILEERERRLECSGCAQGTSFRLALKAARDVISIVPDGTLLNIYGGSTHGESDILLKLIRGDAPPANRDCSAILWRDLLRDPIPSALLTQLDDRGSIASWLYSSCTSSTHALAIAAMDLSDMAEDEGMALVLGIDALSATGVAGFLLAGAATTQACRPFHPDADGTMVSEGAAAILLTNQPIEFGEQPVRLLGIGMSCDAFHATVPEPEGRGLSRAIRNALRNSGVHPKEVDGIIAHGTGTLKNDAAEARAINLVFSPNSVPVTSLKGTLGHTMGASGLFNCLAAAEVCKTGLLPPIISDGFVTTPDLDLVIDEPRHISRPARILVNCSAFGGNNVAAVFGTG